MTPVRCPGTMRKGVAALGALEEARLELVVWVRSYWRRMS